MIKKYVWKFFLKFIIIYFTFSLYFPKKEKIPTNKIPESMNYANFSGIVKKNYFNFFNRFHNNFCFCKNACLITKNHHKNVNICKNKIFGHFVNKKKFLTISKDKKNMFSSTSYPAEGEQEEEKARRPGMVTWRPCWPPAATSSRWRAR